jgi:hypothetical protein
MKKTLCGLLCAALLTLVLGSCKMLQAMSGLVEYSSDFAEYAKNTSTGTLTTNFTSSGTAKSTKSEPTKVGSTTFEAVDDSSPSSSVGYSVKSYEIGAAFNSMALLNPTSSIIYPGAVLVGSSIATGAYTPIVDGERAPITISCSLVGAKSAVVRNPESIGDVSDALKVMQSAGAAAGGGSSDTGIIFSQATVNSSSALNVAVGANFAYEGVASIKAAASFDYSTKNKMTNILVQCQQVYYSVNVDTVPFDEFYLEAPDLTALGDTSPVYVASINYGRLAYFGFTSSESETSMKAALSASFSYLKASGDIKVDTDAYKTLSSATINATIVGGGSDSTGAVTSLDGFINYIQTGGTFSATNIGSPISYTLKFVKDNSVAGTLLYSSYKVRTPVYQSLPTDGEFQVTFDYIGAAQSTAPTTLFYHGLLYCASLDNKSPISWNSNGAGSWGNPVVNTDGAWMFANTVSDLSAFKKSSAGYYAFTGGSAYTTSFQQDPNLSEMALSSLKIGIYSGLSTGGWYNAGTATTGGTSNLAGTEAYITCDKITNAGYSGVLTVPSNTGTSMTFYIHYTIKPTIDFPEPSSLIED